LITIAQAKLQSNVLHSYQDDLFALYIPIAYKHIEDITSRNFDQEYPLAIDMAALMMVDNLYTHRGSMISAASVSNPAIDAFIRPWVVEGFGNPSPNLPEELTDLEGIICGTTFERDWLYKDASGVINVTGYTAEFWLAGQKYTGTVDGPNGLFAVKLSPAQTQLLNVGVHGSRLQVFSSSGDSFVLDRRLISVSA
jgi:hypothetical protein